MINFHPTSQQLEQFSSGNCDPALALIISAHIDMCSVCRIKSQQFQECFTIEAFSEDLPLGPEYQNMLANITSLPAENQKIVSNKQTLELDGRHFTLPRALHRFVGKTGNWSRLVDKLWQAPVDLGDMGKATFIYMEKGGRVPEHTHKGSELTLVIDGQYGDGLADYDCGDFTLMDGSNKHLPHSEADEGCLVFTIVDKPLHFTSGLARLLNPFSHLFFK